MTNKKLKTKAASIAIAAALALTGTVPSFADEKTFEGAPEAPDITAESAIIIDAGSGQVLYEKDADVERDPASITKVLNLLVCLDTLDFDAEVTVDRNTDPTESSIKLQKGETIKVSDIAYCMMLKSANDAAEYLGYLAGGDMETFCEMMNEKAASCGAKKTKYINPNGLNPYSVNNITTARDIALVVREAMRDERFRTIVGTRSYTVPATNKSEERKIYNSNRCLWNGDRVSELKALQKEAEENPPTYTVDEITGEKTMDPASAARNKEIRRLKNKTRYMVEGCIGVKTGYTSTAGGCFAGYASRGNTDIIVVVMKTEGRTDRFRESGKLWDYAFDNFESYTAAKSDEVQYSQKVRRGTLRKVDLGIANDLKVTTLKGADPESTVTTEMVLPEEKPTAPIKKGTVMGQLIAYDNGVEVSSQDLVTLEYVGKGGPLSYIGIADENVPEFIIMLVILLITLFFIIMVMRASARNKKRRERRRQRRMQDSDGDSGKY